MLQYYPDMIYYTTAVNKVKLTSFGEKGAPFITNLHIQTPVLLFTNMLVITISVQSEEQS